MKLPPTTTARAPEATLARMRRQSLERPQRRHLRQIAAGEVRPPGRRARRQQQFRIRKLVAIGQAQALAGGVDPLDARPPMKVDREVCQRMPGDRQPIVAACPLQVVFRQQRSVVGLVGLFGNHRNGALPAELAQRVRRREPGRAAADDRHRSERGVALAEMPRGRLFRRPDLEAIPLDRDRIGFQAVKSRSGRRFAGREVECGVMPRAADPPVGDDALVQRPRQMRAGRAVSLDCTAAPPDEDALPADDAGGDPAVGRRLEAGPLGQIAGIVVLLVAHGATSESG